MYRMNLQIEVWKQVTQHINGIAIGMCVRTLDRVGLLEQLANTSIPLSVAKLSQHYRLRPGYCHLAAKLLAAEGLLRRSGDIASGDAYVEFSETGREWFRWVEAYRSYPRLVASAMNVPSAFLCRAEIDEAHRAVLDQLPATAEPNHALANRIANHIRGPIIAALMYECHRRQLFERFAGKSGHFVPLDALFPLQKVIEAAAGIFAGQGWMILKPGEAALTDAGVVAVAMAAQYGYSICYFPTTRCIPDLMLGRKPFAEPAHEETHVDRALDIQFSGEVFSRQCREPFLKMARRLFDHEDFANQPAAVVDCGAGDGTVLMELYRAIRDETLRGQRLKEYPLLVVAAEYNEVARKTCAQRLAQADIPHFALFGDIGEPEALMRSLTEKGIAPDSILHVNKSVIHNRSYYPAGDSSLTVSPPHSTSVFITPDGDLIPNCDLEQNLLEFFLRWKPFIQKHGMIAIEAHTVPAEITALHIDHSLVTAMDASHGFSHQYLIEYDRFMTIAGLAGWLSRQRVQLGGNIAGATTLSINHFQAA